MIDKLEEFLKGVELDGYSLSKIFHGTIKFLEYFEEDQNLKNQLSVCAQKTNFALQSKIKNSEINLEPKNEIKNLIESSSIIKDQEDENFIRSLFDKNFKLALLFRASENDFSSKKFHQACDNRGATLCLYKSQKG